VAKGWRRRHPPRRGGRPRGTRPHGARRREARRKNARVAAARSARRDVVEERAGSGREGRGERGAAEEREGCCRTERTAQGARRRTFAARLDHGPTRPPPRWTQLDEGLAAYGPVASCLEARTSDPENSGPTPWGSFDAYRAIERQEALRRRRSRLRARGGIPLLRGVRAGRCSARRRAPRGRRGSHGAALPPTGGPRGRRTRQRPHPR
jgi:hypothetical protein